MSMIVDDKVSYLYDIRLPVTIEGMRLTVGAGSFTLKGEVCSLEDDEVFDFPVLQERHGAFGYLVRIRADGTFRMLIDDLVAGDHPYIFDPSGPYENIRCYLVVDIPAGGVSNLNDARVRVFSLKLEEETPPAPAPEG